MKNKYNIILHTTTSCNYNCSYCDVLKDKQNLSKENISKVIKFIKRNYLNIDRFKFFWWEPLVVFENIKEIIDETKYYIKDNYEIVTNTSLLRDEVWEYFSSYFKIIFFSIDSENDFDYDRVFSFIDKYDLWKKVYFNLIISPWKELNAFYQFQTIYKKWYKNFNILPIYFTKEWLKENLLILSSVMKKILDLTSLDSDIKLYWFQSNSWYNSSLINESLFINIDLNIYYSDIVSTKLWQNIKEKLYLWNTFDFLLQDKSFGDFKNYLMNYEKDLILNIKWQSELHKIMDYFSKYLNNKNGL